MKYLAVTVCLLCVAASGHSPAWTTDWLSDDAKQRLSEFGIAPPGDEVLCPQCSSDAAHELSRFGSTACKSLWVCDACLEPFDHFKVLAT